MIGRNDLCWCGSGKKWKKCHFPHQGSLNIKEQYKKRYGILLKTPEEIAGIRKACQFAATVLDDACQMATAGVTTNEIDAFVAKRHKQAKAIPAALHYGHPPFPKGICTSLNEVVCHGIPNDIPLVEGDIVNIDIASIVDGYYGDCSKMVLIGNVSAERKHVCDVSYECLMRAINVCKPGHSLRAIGEAIESYATQKGCSVIYQFVGHGVGVQFHEPPQVHHNRNSLDIPLVPGMTFTIEPMINAGTVDIVIDPENKWEARTKDGRASAQWEHTLLITEDGCDILTLVPSDER